MIEAESLKTASAPTLLEMARMIEAKDPYTAGHTWRVANYGQILAAALDYPPEKIEVMLLAGTLHDIGKVMVPDEILTKPGRLTKEEFDILKKHPQDGFEILKDHEDCKAVLEVVLKHHLNPEWVPSHIVRSPILNDNLDWEHDDSRHLMREAIAINRDAIFRDFFTKLEKAP